MANRSYYELPQFSAILSFIDAIFAQINVGLLIYHVEDVDDIGSARLIYANQEASTNTGTDLQDLVGRRIFEAFPHLEGSDVAATFSRVVQERKAHRGGVVEYADRNVQHGHYATRAFPMPQQCFGVVFDKLPEAEP